MAANHFLPETALIQRESSIASIKKRPDFLRANAGRRVPMPGFVLLARDRQDGDQMIRLGLTVTKKVGNAVVRNRIRRRFREIARAILPEHGVAGYDYVMIGRAGGIERDFAALTTEFRRALRKITA